MALRDLAEELGLDLDRIDEGHRQYHEYTTASGEGLSHQPKRSPASLISPREVKRQQPSPPPQHSTDPDLMRLILRGRSSTLSEPSLHTQIGWEENSAKREELNREVRVRYRPDGTEIRDRLGDSSDAALLVRGSPMVDEGQQEFAS